MSHLFGFNRIRELATNTKIDNLESKIQVLQNWHEDYHHGSLRTDNETSREQAFNQQFFVEILGYSVKPSKQFNFDPKSSTQSGQIPDARIGSFQTDGESDKTVAVVELKGASVSLDKPQKHHGNLSPVQQGFKYKPQYRGCEFVIVSNFYELRLYNDNMLDFEVWTLDDLVDPADDYINFRTFYYLLSKDNLVGESGDSKTKSLLLQARTRQDEIGKKFYRDYSQAREGLLRDIWDNNEVIRQTPDLAISLSQKLVDRVVFCCFAEDSAFIPEGSIAKLIQETNNSAFGNLWGMLKLFFEAVDVGNTKLGIPQGLNGGLFAKDQTLDDLKISEKSLKLLLELSNYDFRDDLTVGVLGHIFEQSITDLEELRASAVNTKILDLKNSSRRKRDGIYYTPDYVVKSIIDSSLGAYLREIEIKCIEEAGLNDKLSEKVFEKRQQEAYLKYQDQLETIRILDPSCGSGAFLVGAFDYLMSEHQRVHAILQPDIFNQDLFVRQILLNNLYGVDLNSESVEIAKLSLWLKSARPGQKLTSLDENIKCGNSLISDELVADKAAFNWQREFQFLESEGGFDVVIGNPPYVRADIMVKSNPLEREYINREYETAKGNWDLFVPFYQKAFDLLKRGGLCSLIVPNKILVADYAEQLRRYLLSKGSVIGIVDVSRVGVFDVDVYPVILTCARNRPQELVDVYADLTGPADKRKLNIDDLNWGVLLSSGQDSQIISQGCKFDDLFDVFSAATVSEAYLLKDVMFDDPNAVEGRVINTGTIDPYLNLWGVTPIRYLQSTYLHPAVPQEVFDSNKPWHKVSKAVVAGMATTIEACYVDTKEYFPAKSTVVVTAKARSKLSAKSALAILNSEPFRNRFVSRNQLNAMAGGYITITRVNIGQSEVPANLSELAEDLEGFADQILRHEVKLQSLSKNIRDLLSSEYSDFVWNNKLRTWWELDFPKFVSALKLKLDISQKNQLLPLHLDYRAQAIEIVNDMEKAKSDIDSLLRGLYSGS